MYGQLRGTYVRYTLYTDLLDYNYYKGMLQFLFHSLLLSFSMILCMILVSVSFCTDICHTVFYYIFKRKTV